MNNDWEIKHKAVIEEFLELLNLAKATYVLKGGTALMLCYGLDRFSEDIDLDSTDYKTIKQIVDSFCKVNDYSYRVAKDTETVVRFMINYGNAERPLKVEISYRNKSIDTSSYQRVDGIAVYNIDTLCIMKAMAYSGRDKLRDLYDLTFICNTYWGELSKAVQDVVRTSIAYKGIEQFDYLINTQEDELIDKDKLSDDFLTMHDKLGLISDTPKLTDTPKLSNRFPSL